MVFKLGKYTHAYFKRFCATTNVNVMELIKGQTLLNCVGNEVPMTKALKEKKVVLFYFSASWCNPCKELLPKIKNVYTTAKKKKAGIEIIYISSDTDEKKYIEYFKGKHGGWYAIKFGDPLAEQLRQYYTVTAIPMIYVIKIKDGTLLSKDGRKDIETKNENVIVEWTD